MSVRISTAALCRRAGISRQNFYKGRRHCLRRHVDADLIESLVIEERKLQPRLGGRKLYYLLKPKLEEAGVKIGRDRFFKVLSERRLLLEPLPRSPRTTNSRHSLPVFPNLFSKGEQTAPNQAWVSDVTYIRTEEGFVYLCLITDAWSRKIVGYYASDSLETSGCVRALERAAATLRGGEHPLHHSDRGCQYCSHAYVGKLRELGLPISMTEELHCYENAKAERVNGILKQEYGLGSSFRSKRQARESIDQAIFLYNTRRPHLSLNYKTPEEMHASKVA